MTAILSTLTVRGDRPVDPDILAILRQTHAAARELEIEYFVGGALARDLILLHVYGKDTGRATRDVDLGIHIDGWETLASLKANLIRRGNFSEAGGRAHRLIYTSQDHAFGIPLDLLPFGGVEQANATDFLLIARHYHEAGNVDRLYDAESALLVETDYDPELAGAMLLGTDVAAICSIATVGVVNDIMAGDQLPQRLIDQLMSAYLSDARDVASTRVVPILDAFRRGLELV